MHTSKWLPELVTSRMLLILLQNCTNIYSVLIFKEDISRIMSCNMVHVSIIYIIHKCTTSRCACGFMLALSCVNEVSMYQLFKEIMLYLFIVYTLFRQCVHQPLFGRRSPAGLYSHATPWYQPRCNCVSVNTILYYVGSHHMQCMNSARREQVNVYIFALYMKMI